MNNDEYYEEFNISRKKLLFRLSIFMLIIVVIFAIITFLKLTNYLGTPVYDYEEV